MSWLSIKTFPLLLVLLSLLGACNSSEEKVENNDVAPSGLSYNPATFVLEKNTPLPVVNPSITGTNLTFSVFPALPAGLSISAQYGYLSGIPKAVNPTTTYTVTAKNSKGSASTTLSIRVNDKILPSVSYAQNRYIFNVGASVGTITPVSSGAVFTGFDISPELPAGLNFNEATGQITGASQEIQANSYHIVNAYLNDGLYVSTSISFELNDIPPTALSYSPASFILQKNTPFTSPIPSASGGDIISFSINPALPTGLNIDPTSGIISGNPTLVRGTALYTVTATNSGGLSNVSISLQVKDLPPTNLSYGTSSLITTRTVTMASQITPTSMGGAVESFSVNPPLPAGLNFNILNGAISGKPSVVQSTKPYTITASNSGGSSSVILNIIVKDLPPQNLSYPWTSEIFVKNTAITSANPASQGGAVNNYTINPTLPSGLSIDSLSGIISGTPLVTSDAVAYEVKAHNAEGYSSYNFVVAVKDEAPQNLNYPSLELVLEKGTLMTAMNPSSTAGVIKNYTVAPILPTGLVLESTSGVLRGTPSIIADRTRYTITGTNPTGSTSRDIFITVNDKAPNSLSYGSNAFTFDRGVLSPEITPSNLGGAIVVYTVTPDLPTGLNLDSSTGTISGTPTVFQDTPQTYTVTGTNSGGSTSKSFTIQINNTPPDELSYSSTGLITLRKNISIASPGIIPTYKGGVINSFRFDSSFPVPAGLVLDTTTGYLSGTPTQKNSAAQLIRIIGQNSGGQSSSDVQIRVLDEPPVLTLAQVEYVFQKGTAISPISPTKTGGAITSYILSTIEGVTNPSPVLPNGLTFSTSTGIISGTPTALYLTEQTYRINAINEGGDSAVNLAIKVLDVPPSNLNYPAGITEILKDLHNYSTGNPTTYVPVNFAPTISGGPVITWEISPALPTGLSFNSSTGAITGIPVQGTGVVAYTITATNSGGTTSKVVNIKIKDSPPASIAYEFPTYNFETADDIFIPSPTTTGGSVTTYSINPSLPTGLLLDVATGAISKSGNVSELAVTTFTITGTNAEGSVNTSFTLKLTASAPQVLRYITTEGGAENLIYFTINEGSRSYLPTYGGGLATSFSFSNFSCITKGPTFATNNQDVIVTSIGSLPGNISLNTTTGAISATVSSVTACKSYGLAVTAANSGGSVTQAINIVYNQRPVAAGVTTLSPTINTLTTMSASGSYEPDDDPQIIYNPDPTKNAIGTKILSYQWTLLTKPVGSVVTTASIGTPTAVSATFTPDKLGVYTFSVVAKDALASSNPLTYTVTVKDVPPSNLIYGSSDYGFSKYVYNVGDSVSISPTASGGAIISYSVSPALPSGLSLNTTTGLVSGTPTVPVNAADYTITATNSGGSTTVALKLWINSPPVANISTVAKLNLGSLLTLNASASNDPDRATALASPWNLVPTTLTYQWSIKTKPVGSTLLASNFSSQTAVSPTITPDKKGVYEFQVIVNDGLIDSAPVTTSVKVAVMPGGLTYGSGNAFVFTKNKDTVALSASVSGDAPFSYSISPSLPSGLGFNASTGAIAGIPTTSQIPTDHTITVVNDGGSSSVVVKLWINEYPTANAGTNLSNVVVGNQQILDGSSSFDVDKAYSGIAPFTSIVPVYAWSLIGLPPDSNATTANILNSSTLNNARFTPGVEGIFVFKFSYFDGLVYNQNFASTRITTQNNPTYQKPVADAGSDIVLLNSPQSHSLSAVNSEVAATYPKTIQWELLSAPVSSALVLLDPTSEVQALDFDVEGVYRFELSVSDGASTVKDQVVVNVGSSNGTSKGGTINTSEVWTLAQSPIRLTSNISLVSGAKITIDPGVLVLGNNYQINMTNGSVEAIGTEVSKIFLRNLSIQKNSSGSAVIDLDYVEQFGGGVCTTNACNGVVKIKNSIFKDLTGSAKVIDSTEVITIEKNVFINSHGFELSSTGPAINVTDNFVYSSQGTGSEIFFAKITKDQNPSVVKINKNWFFNSDSKQILVHSALVDTDVRKNYWQTASPLLRTDQITPFGTVTTRLLYEPFLTAPSTTGVDGRKYIP